MNRWLIKALSLSVLTASLQANYAQQVEDLESEYDSEDTFSLDEDFLVDAEDTSQSPSMPDASATSNPSLAAKSSDENYPGRNRPNEVFSGRPFPSNGVNLSVFGEFLYWTSGIDDFYFAAIGTDTGTLNRSLKDLDNHYEAGFRIGADYSFSAQGWTFGADWTNFSNQTTKTLSFPYGDEVSYYVWTSAYSLWDGENAEGGRVYGSWELNFNQVDITLGKEVFLSKYYSITPNVGGRFAWFNDEFISHRYNINETTAERVSFHNKFHGFGFKMGIDNRFQMGYGIYILANADVGLVYGPMEVADNTTGTVPSPFDPNIVGTRIDTHAHNMLPFIDAQMNLGWRRTFLSNKLGLDLMIGYEYHTFINGHTAYQLPASDEIAIFSKESRNLYMHGMNITAKISF